jgi:hypothetical protein
MKKLVLSVMVTAFAVAVYAGEGKTCSDKEGGSCCAAKTKTSQQAQGQCSMAKETASCSNTAKSRTTAKVLQSPKAQAEARG